MIKEEGLVTLPLKSRGEGNIRHMGIVWKRGQINTAFRRRYFVLDKGVLRYYRDQRSFSNNTKWLGGLSCENMTVDEDLGRFQDRFLFTVTDGRGRKLHCACETLEQRQTWCLYIRNVAA